jgi:hypothetical protein
MSSKTASARPGQDRASLYDEITGKIIAEQSRDVGHSNVIATQAREGRRLYAIAKHISLRAPR